MFLFLDTISRKYKHIDLLLNVAGILGDGQTTPGPERSLDKINREWLSKTFDVNCIGHVMLSKSLVPLLKRTNHDTTISKIVSISARVGSISDNGLGGWYSYRMSKAALNMFTKTASIELKRCVLICFYTVLHHF
jgi:NAD(P)-dependent dehydrogenase (short-subunit alcohol dehydrogenase family)